MKKAGMRITIVTAIAAALMAPYAATPAIAQDWVVQFGTSRTDSIIGLMNDGTGGVWGTGYTAGDLLYQASGPFDAVLVRYDSEGNQVWIRQFGTAENDNGVAIATDMAGGAFVAGQTKGDLGTALIGSQDQFLARFDGQGYRVWVRQFAFPGHNYSEDVVSDGAGGAFVVGFTEPGGSQSLDRDIAVARFDASGNQLWYKKFGTLEHDSAYAAAPDGQGGVFVAGETYGDLSAPNLGYYDAFVAHLDNQGTPLWIRQFGTSSRDRVRAMTVDGAGGVFVAGRTYGNFAALGQGRDDVFIARLDANGDQIWARQFGTPEDDEALGMSPDGAGGLVVAGYTMGNLSGRNRGSYDAFVARFNHVGNRLWIRQFGTVEYDSAIGVASDGGDSLYVSGQTSGVMGAVNTGLDDAYIARYENLPCYSDCDESTGFYELDIFDFLCFQSAFVMSEPYACDCDTSTGNGVCDMFDFLCFQNAFVAGCP